MLAIGNITALVGPLGFVAGGLVLGIAIEFFVVVRVCRILEATGHDGAARLIGNLRGTLTVILTAIGIHAALVAYPLKAGVRDEADRTLAIATILAATIIGSRALAGLLREYLHSHTRDIPSASLFLSLLRIATWSLGGLLVLQVLGISIAPLLAALGVGGLAIALALKDTLENLFSGLQIIASRQIRPGDYIRVETGNEGYVTDITWRNTTLRELGDNLVIIPNSKLAQSIFTNFSLPQHSMAVVTTVEIPRTADLVRVEEIALEVAREFAEQPYARYQESTVDTVKLAVFLKVKQYTDQFGVRSEFMKKLNARLKQEGVLAAPAASAG